MSTISRAPAAAQIAATPSRATLLQTRFRAWMDAYVAWRIEQTAMRQLERMSDRDLRDVGLARSEISHAVTQGKAHDRAFRRKR